MKTILRMLSVYMITVLFAAFIVTANCDEIAPEDIERIRVRCLWDQNKDMTVDPT